MLGEPISGCVGTAYFVISLRDHLAYRLHSALEFLHGPHNAALDQLKLRADGRTQLFQRSVICVDVPDCVRSIRKLPEEIILGSDRVENNVEVLSEAAPGGEKRW
jgi:hypothetical protein